MSSTDFAKTSKENYSKLKEKFGLAELALLLNYGIRGIIHNTPFEGINWKIENSIDEARPTLANQPGSFDRAFLYLAYSEGRLITLYP